MTDAVNAIKAVRDTNAANLRTLIEKADTLSAEELSSEYGRLQAEGIWTALLELAKRVDAAPQVAVDQVNKEISRSMRGI